MRVSKKNMLLVCIVFIWLFVLLNRLQVINTNEVIPAEVEILDSSNKLCALHFSYQEKNYTYTFINDIKAKEKVSVIIKKQNPDKYVVLNFWAFGFPALIVAIFASLVVSLYFHVMYKDISFFYVGKRNGKKELESHE